MTAALRILLVEDAISDAELVREHLVATEPDAVAVAWSRSVGEALLHLSAHAVDCVLLDLTLPDAAGLEALGELTYAAPQVPVVVLTGVDAEEVARQAVEAGAQDYLVKGQAPGPVLLRALRYAVRRGRSQRRLGRLLATDAVTGLPNRAGLLERLALALRRTVRTRRRVGVALLDLEAFGAVNAALGHEAGDRLLRLVGERLAAAAGPGATLARYGDDEFAVLCDDVAGSAGLEKLALTLEAALAERALILGSQEVRLVGRVGAALAVGPWDSPERLLGDADSALQAAKRVRGPVPPALSSLRFEAPVVGEPAPAPAPASPPSLTPAAPLRRAVEPAPRAVIRVFLCDDVADLRLLMRTFLEDEEDLEVVGEAGDGAGLATAVRAAAADVILLDLSMPDVDGLEATAALREATPELGIVVLSGFEQERMEAQALALGADRYLEKRAGMGEVRRAVREVAGARRAAPALLEGAA